MNKTIFQSLLAAAAIAAVSGPASAALVELRWVTTVQSVSGGLPGVVGETLTTIIRVDNGASSLTSQTWNDTDFVSYRQEGSSGWWFESSEINLGASSGFFSTDATDDVVAAGNWQDSFPTGAVTTSWLGATLGGWWNNGRNETSCVDVPRDCVFATNVGDNLLGSSWSASLVGDQVPEPTSWALLAAALAGLGVARRNRR